MKKKKKLTKKFKIVLISSVALILLVLVGLKGCGNGEEEVVVDKPVPQVEVMDLNGVPEYVISEVGTIKPTQEIEIISKASGTVNQLTVTLGDNVKEGDVLGVIDYGDYNNAAQINLDTAHNQLNTARSNLDEVQISSQNTVSQAENVVDSLESTLEKLKRNLKELEETNATTKTTLKNALANAQTNVDNAQISYDNIISSFDQSWDDYYEGVETSLDSIIVNAESYNQFATTVLNPYNNSTVTTSNLPSGLGVYDSSQRNDAVNMYNDYDSKIADAQAFYDSNLPVNDENIDDVVDEFKEFVDYSRDFVSELSTLLNNSTAGTGLTSSALDSYKASISTYEGVVLGDVNSINSLNQSYQTLQLNETTQSATASNSLTVANNQLNDAENALTNFETTGESSIKDLEVQIELTEKDLDSANSSVDSAKRNKDLSVSNQNLQINTYENQVRLAQDSLENNKITTSIDGAVSELHIDEGDYVSVGTLVAKVIQHEQVKVVFYVSKDIANKLAINNQIAFEVTNNGSRDFVGVISKISPSADPISKKIKIEAITSNDDLYLKPEMFVDVMINISETTFDPNRVYIPLNSVIVGQNEQFVFVVKDDKAMKKVIEMGEIFDKWVEITDGLAGSDLIVVEGHRNLQEGEEVQY